jgi:hypothetical protein
MTSVPLEQLYDDWRAVTAELLAARGGRIGTRWWSGRLHRRSILRLEIDAEVKRRAKNRRWWDDIP